MKRPRRDPIADAILAEIATVDRALTVLRAPMHAFEDIRQEVTIVAYGAAVNGALEWQSPAAVRAFLWVVTGRRLLYWYEDNPIGEELRDDDEPAAIDAERLYIGRETVTFCARATTPERWKVLRAYAKGIPVTAIARREKIAVGTVYGRIHAARADIAAALAREDAAIFVRRRRK